MEESVWPTSVAANNCVGTPMPWATAVKSPPDQRHSMILGNPGFGNDHAGTIGSWRAPEPTLINRSGWNSDTNSRNDGQPDDGTAIWGNPSAKKTGIDWTEKESATTQAQKSTSTEKRKAEPVVSSLNGTEAWGTPQVNNSFSQQQQSSSKNDNSGNVYGLKSSKELGWGEASISLPTSENSSPPVNFVWNKMGVNNKQQKPSDWLSSSSGNDGLSSDNVAIANSRIDELNQQLHATNIFDPVLSISNGMSANKNSHFDHPLGVSVDGSNYSNDNGSDVVVGGSVMNDLKQAGANYSANDLLDSPSRQLGPASINNHQSQQRQQLASAVAHSSSQATASANPSRDLLKQMVHQIHLAVQAGHLNAHIMNQPMSTPTLQLVYQLLQQIKALQQLQEIRQRAGGSKADMSSNNALEMQINRIRQNISLLQKAITHQQPALSKTDGGIGMVDTSMGKQQQTSNRHSYATISELTTNSKVPANMSNIINPSNIDSFRGGGLIDTLRNSNSDPLRSAQATYEANAANIDKTLSSLIQVTSGNILDNSVGGPGNGCPTITSTGDLTKADMAAAVAQQHGFKTNCGGIGQQQTTSQQQSKALLSSAQNQQQQQNISSSSAWSAFSSNDLVSPPQAWPSQLRISSNASQLDHSRQASSSYTSTAASSVLDMVGSDIRSASDAWRSGSVGVQQQRPTSSPYNWGELASSSLHQTFNTGGDSNDGVFGLIDGAPKRPGQTSTASSSSSASGNSAICSGSANGSAPNGTARPGPPPGLGNNWWLW